MSEFLLFMSARIIMLNQMMFFAEINCSIHVKNMISRDIDMLVLPLELKEMSRSAKGIFRLYNPCLSIPVLAGTEKIQMKAGMFKTKHILLQYLLYTCAKMFSFVHNKKLFHSVDSCGWVHT